MPSSKFTVKVEVSTSGLGVARYTAANQLYLNAWMDWDANGVWTPSERIIEWNGGPGLNDVCPTGNLLNPAAPWPADTNARILEFEIIVPSITIPEEDINKPLYSRFRLDYDENVGHENHYSDPALLNDKYAASFGEVEDYKYQLSVGGYGVPIENTGIHLTLTAGLAGALLAITTILMRHKKK